MIKKKTQSFQNKKGYADEDRKEKKSEKELYNDLNYISFKTSFERLNAFYRGEKLSKKIG